MADDFIMTIDSDTEDVSKPIAGSSARKTTNDDTALNPDFVFDVSGDPYIDALAPPSDLLDLVKAGSKPVSYAFVHLPLGSFDVSQQPISVDDIIERRRLKAKRKRDDDSDDEDEEESLEDAELGGFDWGEQSGGESSEEADGDDEPSDSDRGPEDDSASEVDDDEGSSQDHSSDDASDESSDDDESEPETQAELDRKAAFFESDSGPSEQHASFLSMNLSRPIVKAITSLGYNKPTPIQSATVPVALLGKDVVGNAVTGSGKTAAFIIPMLERLLYRERGKNAAATRCLVLVPTRELGVQCFDVGTKLAAHTDVTFCLVVGGLSVKAQEVSLRNRPDVVIATPGRLIDHIRNSPSFTLDALDILVLDEADRMLSDGFADELTEIIKSCPTSRQTMLFSATMTDSVDELVRLSLNKPVRLFVDPKRTTARGLVQEFVRVRAGKESERPGLLAALCKRNFKNNVIVFLRSKKLAHQMRIVFTLLGLRCEELHGDLTQEQRLRSLQLFRDGAVDYLMATDLAARGLDIKGVETVINYDMPNQLAQYLHRVGRTARAGKKGRSVTLVGEADRKMLKAAIKHSAGEDQVRHRIVPAEIVSKWVSKLDSLKSEVSEVMQEEKEEKQFRQAEMEVKKGQNMIEHEAEIYSRPARTWFQTGKEKSNAAALGKQQHEALESSKKRAASTQEEPKPKRDKFAGLSRRVKRRKLAREEDEALGNAKAMGAAIRSAKKAARPSKIGLPETRPSKGKKSKDGKSARKKEKSRPAGGFDKDLGQKAARSEGIRAKKSDKIGGMGKKGGKRKSGK
ncbi:hypothetical protein HGRIS_007894 [Hohenbuehelia grisea]|uniref:RNA helicase n=1 Tax=Hohenbuehelia grisea TaxID=104357 RepID=A0ABR3J6H6_9AGAR